MHAVILKIFFEKHASVAIKAIEQLIIFTTTFHFTINYYKSRIVNSESGMSEAHPPSIL